MNEKNQPDTVGTIERSTRPVVALTEWRRIRQSGFGGEWWAAKGFEIRKRGGVWIATYKGAEVARDEFLANVMMELSMPAEIAQRNAGPQPRE